jgi:hypothetical protein
VHPRHGRLRRAKPRGGISLQQPLQDRLASGGTTSSTAGTAAGCVAGCTAQRAGGQLSEQRGVLLCEFPQQAVLDDFIGSGGILRRAGTCDAWRQRGMWRAACACREPKQRPRGRLGSGALRAGGATARAGGGASPAGACRLAHPAVSRVCMCGTSTASAGPSQGCRWRSAEGWKGTAQRYLVS